MVGDELGAEAEYHPEAYALLIGVTPPDDAGHRAASRGLGARHVARVEMGAAGRARANATLRFRLEGRTQPRSRRRSRRSNQLTMWVDDSVDAPVSISVRPLLPGDDPCSDLFEFEE